MDNYYEDTINLKDTFFYIVKQWKKIVIGALIGLLIGCGFSFYKMMDLTPESALKKIGKIAEINKNNIIQLADYTSLYNKEIEYSNNSVLMNLDSNSVYQGNVSYTVSGKSSDVDVIISSLTGILNIDDNLNKICKALEEDYSNGSINEVISIDKQTNSSYISINSNDFKSGDFIINVYGPSETFTSTVCKAVKEIVADKTNELITAYPGSSIYNTQDSIVYGYSDYVSKSQASRITSRQAILNGLTTAKSKLSDDELLYYSYYYDYDNTFVDQKIVFSKKWPVLFAVGFGVLTTGLYFLRYLFDERLKNFDLIKDKYNLPLIGIIDTNKKEYKGIDKYINDLEHKEFNNLDYIKSSMSLLDGKNIMLCSEYNELNDDLSKLDKRLSVTGSLTNDTKSLDELKKTDGVILVSKLWDTKESDIQRQIDIVNNAGKKILGVIGLE